MRTRNRISVAVENVDGSLIYKIEKNEFTASEKFDKIFYIEKDFEYIRTYPNTLMFRHDEHAIGKKYEQYVNREYFQRKDTTEIDKAIEWVCDTHAEHNIKWWLTGSSALYVRGLNIIPHDVDVMTYFSEKEKIAAAVFNNIIEPFHFVSGWVVKGFGVVDYGCRIDYAFEPENYVDANGYCDFGPYAENHLEEIIWHGRKIFIPDVNLHIMPNVNRNRMNVVNAINDYIENKKTT
jgi:hypothetical protein